MSVQVAKNLTKYQSYKYAFEKIDKAIELEFYLEAVVIAESIISDRLLSFLKKEYSHLIKSKLTIKSGLYELTKEWRLIDKKVLWKEAEDLISEINEWRNVRNSCAHAVAKSHPGTSTQPVDEFINQARDCAIRGKKLATYICSYTQKRKSEIKRHKENRLL
jgi:CO dehydrogenase/acetyl-CoA synthase alpha subunit